MPIAFLISLAGLAQTAVHKAEQTEVIPPSYFATSADTGSGSLSSFMSTLSLATPGGNHVLLPEKRPTFAFHRRIHDDPAFRVELPSQFMRWYITAMKAVGGAIHNLVQEWTAEWLAGTRSDADAEVRLKGMVEEVIWGNVIWYGVGGWVTRGDSGRAMNADFFLCVSPLDSLEYHIPADLLVPPQKSAHLVNSSIFLPGVVLRDEGTSPSSPFKPGTLPFSSRLLLLQAYLAVCTVWKITRGNHSLPIADFYAATEPHKCLPARAPGAGALPSTGSAWTRIIPSAIRAPDEHTPKIARALIDFARRWGTRPPGYFSAGETDAAGQKMPSLEGIERLDGTLFVRVAGLTLDRLGWVHEGEDAGPWDKDGFPS